MIQYIYINDEMTLIPIKESILSIEPYGYNRDYFNLEDALNYVMYDENDAREVINQGSKYYSNNDCYVLKIYPVNSSPYIIEYFDTSYEAEKYLNKNIINNCNDIFKTSK